MTNTYEIHQKLISGLQDKYAKSLRIKDEALKKLISEKKVKHEALATHVGKDKTTIGRYINGEIRTTSILTLYWMSEFLKCDLFDIAYPANEHVHNIKSSNIAQLSLEALLNTQINISHIQRFHTLLKKNCDILEIHYPIRIRTLVSESVKKSKRHSNYQYINIDNVDDITSTVSLITGQAGQGKSVLLHFLALREYELKTSIPILISLGNLKENVLKDAVIEQLVSTRVCNDYDNALIVIESNYITVFLDAFDEIDENMQYSVMEDIESFHIEFPKIKIVISSRPYSTITYSDKVVVYEIVNLNYEEICGIVRKYADEDVANDIISKMEVTKDEFCLLLTKPILVVLFVISYDYKNEMPTNLIDFFNKLFYAMLERHNNVDGRKKHNIKSGLRSSTLELFFKCLSLFWHANLQSKEAHIVDIRPVLSNCLKITNISCDPDVILNDVSGLTNLIIRESDYYAYAHNNIREYYAAAHVKDDIHEEQKQIFYKNRLNDWDKWKEVLRFLSVIDAHSYCMYFELPDLERFYPFDAPSFLYSMKHMIVFMDDSNSFYKIMFYEYKSFTISEFQNAHQCIPLTIKFHLTENELRDLFTLEALKQIHNNLKTKWEYASVGILKTIPILQHFKDDKKWLEKLVRIHGTAGFTNEITNLFNTKMDQTKELLNHYHSHKKDYNF